MPFPIPSQQNVQQVLAHVKVGRTEGGECRWEIYQAALCGAIENPERTRDLEPLCASRGNPVAMVHQQQVGLDRGRQCDGCTFAVVEGCERSARSCGSAYDREPAGRRSGPLPNDGRRHRIIELVVHDGGDRKAAKQLRHEIDPTNEHQVVQGPGVGDG